jgi:hypothetical protein
VCRRVSLFSTYYHHLPATADAGLLIFVFQPQINSLSPSFQLRFFFFSFFSQRFIGSSGSEWASRQKIEKTVRHVGTKTNRPHFEPQEKNGLKKSWYPSDKSTIEMLMDVGSCCCFPNENSSIHPSSGGYRLSLIRCARCPGVKKVPRHRPPPPTTTTTENPPILSTLNI